MIDVAHAAGRHTLEYFRRDDLVVDAKSDASPVTIADREAEQLVRQRLAEQFPSDSVQGEEFAEQSGKAEKKDGHVNVKQSFWLHTALSEPRQGKKTIHTLNRPNRSTDSWLS